MLADRFRLSRLAVVSLHPTFQTFGQVGAVKISGADAGKIKKIAFRLIGGGNDRNGVGVTGLFPPVLNFFLNQPFYSKQTWWRMSQKRYRTRYFSGNFPVNKSSIFLAKAFFDL